ncbi:hypothetical protein C9374_012437 [Naegleria lovaniensis]|uniref:Uncharacterized protein n=1 Tax=Naegleria lovaniensis TaxID=51637 RepID=A0AA88KVY2_NAELO|nr:uncharacterized protein C9374_012437 [Naegleria lovaniensis]KAG2392185.1 hypothetical protein C9374_012437 [Naegleria lovaniensis]
MLKAFFGGHHDDRFHVNQEEWNFMSLPDDTLIQIFQYLVGDFSMHLDSIENEHPIKTGTRIHHDDHVSIPITRIISEMKRNACCLQSLSSKFNRSADVNSNFGKFWFWICFKELGVNMERDEELKKLVVEKGVKRCMTMLLYVVQMKRRNRNRGNRTGSEHDEESLSIILEGDFTLKRTLTEYWLFGYSIYTNYHIVHEDLFVKPTVVDGIKSRLTVYFGDALNGGSFYYHPKFENDGQCIVQVLDYTRDTSSIHNISSLLKFCMEQKCCTCFPYIAVLIDNNAKSEETERSSFDSRTVELIETELKKYQISNYQIVQVNTQTGEGTIELFEQGIRMVRKLIYTFMLKEIIEHDKKILANNGFSTSKCLIC